MGAVNAAIPTVPKLSQTNGIQHGRVVSHCPSSTLVIAATAAVALAIWKYLAEDYVIAASNSVFASILCFGGICYWRFIGAVEIEESVKNLQQSKNTLENDVNTLAIENKQFALEVNRFFQLFPKWRDEQKQNLQVFNTANMTLEETVIQFRLALDELTEFVSFFNELKPTIADLGKVVKEFKNQAPVIKSGLLELKSQTDVLQPLTTQLDAKITQFGTINVALIKDIRDMINYIKEFEKFTKDIAKLYEEIKKTIKEFTTMVVTFEEENNTLGAGIEKGAKLAAALEKRVAEIAEVVNKVEQVQKKRTKRTSRKRELIIS